MLIILLNMGSSKGMVGANVLWWNMKPSTQKSCSHPDQTADGMWVVKLSYLWVYHEKLFFFSSCEISGSVHNHEVQQEKLIVLKLSSIWEIKMKIRKKIYKKKPTFFFSHFLFPAKTPQHSCSIWHYFKIQLLRVLYSIVLTWVSSVVFSKQHSPGRKSPLEGSCGGTLKEVA